MFLTDSTLSGFSGESQTALLFFFFFFSCVFLEFLNFLCQKRLKKFFGQMVSFKYLLRYTEKAFPSTGEPWTSVPIPQILEGDKV